MSLCISVSRDWVAKSISRSFPHCSHALYCRLLARPSLDPSSAREIVELNVWDPPIFALKLFWYVSLFSLSIFLAPAILLISSLSPLSLRPGSWFSPIQAIILRGLDSENWQYFLPVAALVGAQVFFLPPLFPSISIVELSLHHQRIHMYVYADVLRSGHIPHSPQGQADHLRIRYARIQ